MKMRAGIAAIVIASAVTLTGCASRPTVAQSPVWVSKGINGLQSSICDCGGVENKKQFEKRRKAMAEAQAMRHSKGGHE